jgi:hypothetical protein
MIQCWVCRVRMKRMAIWVLGRRRSTKLEKLTTWTRGGVDMNIVLFVPRCVWKSRIKLLQSLRYKTFLEKRKTVPSSLQLSVEVQL